MLPAILAVGLSLVQPATDRTRGGQVALPTLRAQPATLSDLAKLHHHVG